MKSLLLIIQLINKSVYNTKFVNFNGNFTICIDNKRNDTIESVSCYEFKIDNDKAIVDANL